LNILTLFKKVKRQTNIMRTNVVRFFLIALPLALVWLSVILFYTRGGLAVGGDWPGYYDALSAIKTGIPHAIVYGIGLLLARGNIYVGFYTGSFIGLLLNMAALFYFLATLFREWKDRVPPYVVAGTLYAFNMFALYDTFKSIIGLANVAVAGFLLFLAEAIKLYRHMVGQSEFSKWDGILMGVGIAVSSRVPPNSFRILPAEGIIVASLLAWALIEGIMRKYPDVRQVFKKFLIKLPLISITALVGMLYWEIPFFTSLKESIETAFYAASAHKGTSVLNAPYASLVNTFRILGVWVFPTHYCPYHELYSHDPFVTITSFMWPVVALGLSILLAEKKRRPLILSLVLFSLLIISWDTADNPPVGPLNKFITSVLPLSLAFFPTYYLSGTFLPLIYVALTTFTVVRAVELSCNFGGTKIPSICHKISKLALFTLLITILLVPSIPFFNGSALGQYFDPSIKGIWVPEEYFEAKDIALQHQGVILLWPSLTTYVQTSWGYQGTNGFYNSFFSPLKVVTPDFFGGYTEYSTIRRLMYTNLTRPPIRAGELRDITDLLNKEKISVFGVKYGRFNGSIRILVNNTDRIDIGIPFRSAIDISNYTFLILELSSNPSFFMEGLAKSNNFWIGIGSAEGVVGWYILGSTSNTYSINDEGISVSILIGFPDKPWAASYYNPSNVTRVIIRLITRDLREPVEVNFSLKSVKVAFPDVDPSIISLWKNFGVKYLLLDKSIVSGAASAYEPYYSSLPLLTKNGVLRPVLIGKNIELYQVVTE
jgi:hypothetical protein